MADLIQHYDGNEEGLIQKIQEASGLVIVDFFATWCGPCKRLGQQLPHIAEENKDVTIIKVDIDENEELAAKYGVSSVPHLYFVKKDGNGFKTFDHFAGANVDRINECITKYK